MDASGTESDSTLMYSDGVMQTYGETDSDDLQIVSVELPITSSLTSQACDCTG